MSFPSPPAGLSQDLAWTWCCSMPQANVILLSFVITSVYAQPRPNHQTWPGTNQFRTSHTFLGASAKLRKATVSYVMSVCLSVRMEQLVFHWRDFHKFLHLSSFRKSVEKVQVLLHLTRISDTLCEYIYTAYTHRVSRGNVPDFGRIFLTLKYTDLTQNTYMQSWTVTEIMAREKCGLLAVPRTVPVQLMRYPYTAHVRPWEWNAVDVASATLNQYFNTAGYACSM